MRQQSVTLVMILLLVRISLSNKLCSVVMSHTIKYPGSCDVLVAVLCCFCAEITEVVPQKASRKRKRTSYTSDSVIDLTCDDSSSVDLTIDDSLVSDVNNIRDKVCLIMRYFKLILAGYFFIGRMFLLLFAKFPCRSTFPLVEENQSFQRQSRLHCSTMQTEPYQPMRCQ